MATKTRKKKTSKAAPAKRVRPGRWLLRWGLRVVSGLFLIGVFLVILWGTINPPTTWYMMSEKRRLGSVDQHWVPMESIAPVMARSAVAAEDANFCLHWGFDVGAIRSAIESGGNRGASTISQQVVKNVFLWHGRNWTRKALEAGLTPLVEALWSKERILEVYLNVAEFDEGVFGVEAAARHYFRVGPEALSPVQAARLAAVLPNPKDRSAADPSSGLRRRAASIRDGAATIAVDGRSDCFE
ncbi:monofunctional biosynthetic peptidoglycan transglycosylase [Aliishimia ponticola]|nr:monofunctional biosynthetic peptidoglycan transglycosylase [Aliishimia ponticola]